MSGIQDFIGTASQKLGVSRDSIEEGTGGILTMIRQRLGQADFGKLTAAIPGAAELAQTKAGAGVGGVLGGLAAKAEGLLGTGGGAAGAIGALSSAGLTGDKAQAFLSLFADFVKRNVAPELLKSISGKVPGLSGLLG